MKNKKQIISAIAAASVLSITTGVSAFASNQAAKNEKAEEAVTVTEEVAVAEEEIAASEIEEAAETEDAAVEEETEAAEETEEAVAEEAAEEAEKPAVEPEKPAKPIGPKELKDKIAKVFDFDNADFVDEDSKSEWFDFCIADLKIKEHINKPEPPKPPVKPEIDEDAVKPEPPVKPEADENAVKPEPPVKPEADAEKPEPPKPAEDLKVPEAPKPHEHIAPLKDKEAADETTDEVAVEIVAEAE